MYVVREKDSNLVLLVLSLAIFPFESTKIRLKKALKKRMQGV